MERDALFHVGDNTPIVVTFVDQDDTVINISTATEKQIILTDPSGNAEDLDCEFYTDGTDGLAVYEPTDEIDEAGIWKIQGYAEINGKVYHSLIEIFEVEGNLL